MNKYRLAIFGCGYAAREIHASRIKALSDLFEVVALCDCNPMALDQMGKLFPKARCFENLNFMLSKIEADALVILTPLHSEAIEVGLEKKLHIFVEKPFCESLEDARRLAIKAKEQARILMVGAMRVFDPALLYLKSQIESIGPILWVEIRDFCGQGMSSASRSSLVDGNFQFGLPSLDHRLKNSLQTLLLEFVHDASILRELFGAPISCRDAFISHDGWSVLGRLQLPGGIPCNFAVAEFGLVKRNIFEVNLTIASEKDFIKVLFGDPNILGGATTIVLQSGTKKSAFSSDPFMAEWLEFHHAIHEGRVTRNGAQDGLADLELSWRIFDQGHKNE